MASTPNPAAEELTSMMADHMNLESYQLENRRLRSRENVSPVSNLLPHPERTQGEPINLSSAISPVNLSNGYDTPYDSRYIHPVQTQHQHSRAPAISVQTQPNFNGLDMTRRPQYQNGFGQQEILKHENMMSYARDSDMEVQHTQNPITVFQPNYQNTCTTNCTMNQNDITAPMDSYDLYLQSLVSSTTVPTNTYSSISQNGIHVQGNQQRNNNYNGNQLQFIREKFPSDLELDAFKEELECDMDTIISNELNIGDGGFDFDFEQLASPMMNNTPVTVGELSGRLF
jgi:hypothetical protein